MDARGAIAVTERVVLIGRVRKVAQRCAKAYVAQREHFGFPLLPRHEDNGAKKNGTTAGSGAGENAHAREPKKKQEGRKHRSASRSKGGEGEPGSAG
jgi:hypothetical protein